MNFNEKQSKKIYDFVIKYNAEGEFSNSIQWLYNNEPSQLSILEIYTLEEILRYGTKGLYNKFLETKGIYTEEQATNLFDEFMKLLNEDDNFKKYKKDQLKNYPETLSDIEMFAFRLISESKAEKEKMHKEMTDELDYDPLNPILYSYDKQIRETLENLFFGEFIHQLLDLPAMKPVKVRQKENGRIANIDKPLIIEKVRVAISDQEFISQFQQVINNRYVKVKMDLLLGKGTAAFEQYLKFNTNITTNEIIGLEKEQGKDTFEQFCSNIMDEISKRKEQNNRTSKK